LPGVEIAAVCDVFQQKMRKAGEAAPGAINFADYRKLLSRKDLDAVIIATPDHWHAAMAIDAMNAGKDVYVEKPLTFRPEEGPEIVGAAEANQRICQVGLQRRSATLFRRAKQEIVDAGLLGKVTFVRAVWHSGEPTTWAIHMNRSRMIWIGRDSWAKCRGANGILISTTTIAYTWILAGVA